MTDLRSALTDAGYVAVGLGVLGFQQLQVRRRELERQLADVRQGAEGFLGSALDDGVKLVEERLEGVGGLGEQVDRAVEQLGTQFDQLRQQVRAVVPV